MWQMRSRMGRGPLRSGTTGPLTLTQLQRKMEERRLRLQEAANRCGAFLSPRRAGLPVRAAPRAHSSIPVPNLSSSSGGSAVRSL